MPRHDARKTVKAVIALILSLCLLVGAGPAALAMELSGVSVVSAPLTTQSSATDGMVRVYLSSLGNPSSINLSIVGSYSVNGDTSRSLSSGSAVTVGFSSATGAITLTQNGTKTNMGTYFALRRHSASGTNGVKISQAKEPGNAYPGDISFQSVRQSSGSYKLYTVAHIFIENYLYGVLPYEMGNSTNIEALKAQAVAARTYTVRMMNARSSGYYDVVDTTNDQVYRGTPSGNANCVSAVNATKGIVLMYGSTYAMTYYSASNGGQTESAKNAMSSSSYSYLPVKDDPFDYANPNCTVKKKVIYKDLTSASNPSGLTSLLKTKVVSALSGSGATASNTVLQTLKSVTPHTPKYASPSRLYTKMDFTVLASVGGASMTATVTCGIFTELESLLSMSIQSSQNELWSVVSAASTFTLQARRYGHGVGMSQRGAMYMAKLGYSYDEILGFYYVGCKRVQHSFTNTILNASGTSETTVEDPADMEETTDACKGTVKLVSAGSSIAIRAGKSTSGAILGTAGNGAIMTVLAADGSWCFVKYGNIQGYLPQNALSITGTPSGSEGAATSVAGFAKVTASDYVNLRESGSMSATVISTAPSGAVMTVFSQSGSWAYVQYCATVAYVNTNYVAISTAYPSSTVSTGSATATVVTEDGTGTVNLRQTASTDGQVLAKVPSGAQVTVSSDDGSWAVVTYNGTTGYMVSSYLTMDGESLDNTDSGTGDDTPGDTATSAAATVTAEIGYLRASASAEAASIMLIAKGESVTVTQRGADWCAVTYGGTSGYILTEALSFTTGGTGGTGSTGGTSTNVVATATVTTASGSLNLRMEAKAGSQILTTIPRLAQVDITSVGATWCGVMYEGYNGYAMTCFLTISGQTTGEGGSTDATTAQTATVATQSGSLNLRAEARAGSQILRTIPQYAAVSVLQKGAEWSRVTYAGTTGYAMTVFLAFSATDTTEPGDTTGTGDAGAGDSTGGSTEPSDPSGDSTPDTNDPDEPVIGDNTDANTLYAVVSTASGSLNLRRDALPGGDVLARIPKGTTIVITQRLSAWSLTTYAGQTGYVMNAFLSFHQGQQVNTDAVTATVTTASGSLNLRTEPSATGGVILRIPQYAAVSVQQRGETWCYLAYGGSMGYAMTRFLTFAAGGQTTGATDAGAADAETGDASATVQTAYVQTASGGLNLRQSPQSGAKVLVVIPRNSAVQVTSRGADWCQVTYDAYAGYVVTSFLRFETANTGATDMGANDANGSTEPSSPNTGSGEAPSDANATDAWALTASGTLSLYETSQKTADILAEIPRLSKLRLLLELGAWSYVEYGGAYGYVQSADITKTEPTEQPPQSTGVDETGGIALDVTLKAPDKTTYATVTPTGDAAELSLYSQCSKQSAEIGVVPQDARVEILLRGQDWCMVQYENKQGYCLTDSLTIDKV